MNAATFDVAISEKLRERIANCGLTQQELAKETKISQPTISRFMTGERGMRLDAVETLCDFFNLTLVDEPTKPARKRRKT